jgi:hypothetical protein
MLECPLSACTIKPGQVIWEMTRIILVLVFLEDISFNLRGGYGQ